MREPVIGARVPQHVKDKIQDLGARELLIAVYRGLEDGSLTFDGVILHSGLDTREFERACESRKRRPEDVLRAITEQIR